MLILFLMFYFSCLIADFGRNWFFPLEREDIPEAKPERDQDTAKVISLQEYQSNKENNSSRSQYVSSGN